MISNRSHRAQLGIKLMRNTKGELHGYGCHPDPKIPLDFDWQLFSFPLLPEELLIQAASGFREI